MTPEERFTRIENLLQSLTENVVQHDTQIEKLNAGIQNLIVVSRTVVDSQQQVTAQIQGLTEAQRHTDDKLNALIQVVDRLTENINRLSRGPGSNGKDL